MTTARLKIVVLAGRDCASTRQAIEAIRGVPGIDVLAVLLDTERPSFARRLKNLRRNVRREGWTYVPYRVQEALAALLDSCAARFACETDAWHLRSQAFPGRHEDLSALAASGRFRLLPVVNLNSPEAAKLLLSLGADLGVVLGTRILRPSTFGVPRLGCVNLHKGAVPGYRGQPPGFWELYDGCATAGVTVHRVDEGLDTGDVLGTATVPIVAGDTEQTLRRKLDREGAALLARCIVDLAAGALVPQPQEGAPVAPRTNPTRRQREELFRRRPQMPSPAPARRRIAKTAFHLALFYGGLYHLRRSWRRLRGRSRAAILLYHRVDGISDDPLTASTERFSEHLAMLGRRYRVRDTSWLLDCLEKGRAFPPDTVVIHFDDCYRVVRTEAAPILAAAGMPATAFIASGFVGTARRFEHDAAKSPFVYENLSGDEIRELRDRGFEIGAHTVNHANLGRVGLKEVEFEVLQSREDLEKILGPGRITLFSFPFGRLSDISAEARSFITHAGFRALFSAYGGWVTAGTSLFDIPRMGASTEHRCLDLMMEIEGISIGDLARRFSRSAGPQAC